MNFNDDFFILGNIILEVPAVALCAEMHMHHWFPTQTLGGDIVSHLSSGTWE